MSQSASVNSQLPSTFLPDVVQTLPQTLSDKTEAPLPLQHGVMFTSESLPPPMTSASQNSSIPSAESSQDKPFLGNSARFGSASRDARLAATLKKEIAEIKADESFKSNLASSQNLSASATDHIHGMPSPTIPPRSGSPDLFAQLAADIKEDVESEGLDKTDLWTSGAIDHEVIARLFHGAQKLRREYHSDSLVEYTTGQARYEGFKPPRVTVASVLRDIDHFATRKEDGADASEREYSTSDFATTVSYSSLASYFIDAVGFSHERVAPFLEHPQSKSHLVPAANKLLRIMLPLLHRSGALTVHMMPDLKKAVINKTQAILTRVIYAAVELDNPLNQPCLTLDEVKFLDFFEDTFSTY